MSEDADIGVREPVRGRQFGLAEVAAMLDHRGWAHFFCSAVCRDTFQATPEAFAERSPSRPPSGNGNAAPSAQWPDPRNMAFKSRENEQ